MFVLVIHKAYAIDFAVARAARNIHRCSCDFHRRSGNFNRSALANLDGRSPDLEGHVPTNSEVQIFTDGLFCIPVDFFFIVSAISIVLFKGFALLIVVVIPVTLFLSTDRLVILIPERSDARSHFLTIGIVENANHSTDNRHPVQRI